MPRGYGGGGGYGGGYGGGGGRRGRGGRGGRGRGRSSARPQTESSGEPAEPKTPNWTKFEKITPNRSIFVLAKVGEVDTSATAPFGRGPRFTPQTCTRAVIGDETASISLYTTDEATTKLLQDNSGKVLGLLNVQMRIVNGDARIEAGRFSAIKPVAELGEALPEGTSTDFELNTTTDRTKKPLRKPTWTEVKQLKPERKNLNLLVKVGAVEIQERTSSRGPYKIAQATVYDGTGNIQAITRSNDGYELLKQGSSVVLLNAHTELFQKKFIRVVIDKWADVKSADSFPAEIKPEGELPDSMAEDSKKMSEVEWVEVKSK